MKLKAKAAGKEKKGIIYFFSLMLVLRIVSFCAHVFLALTELKNLLLRKDNEVTDLANIMCRHADAVEKLPRSKLMLTRRRSVK